MSELLLELDAPESAALPRELILASAGSGKTYRLSSRIIGLLAAGAATDAIFASTFTRKAAGEILDRVLMRLADATLSDAAAVELADHAALTTASAPHGFVPPVNREFWAGVLERLVSHLHRFNVGTLDAYFIRTARSFANELGLPPAWHIIDEAASRRLLSDALQHVLQRGDPGVLVEIVRGIARERVGRSVHDALLRDAGTLLALQQDLASDAVDAWSAFDAAVAASRDAVPPRAQALAAHVESLPIPTRVNGAPHAGWTNALAKAAGQIRDCEWEQLLDGKLCKAATAAEGAKYDSIVVPHEVRAAFAEACELARLALGVRYAAQARAMGRFAAVLEGAVEQARRQTGGYRFEDVTRLLGGPDALATRPDLHYRLDMRATHLLLDEFQDTSLPQWEALEPLADELLSGYAAERAAVIVADPKQSIYGWRGASPLLVERVGDRYALRREVLAKSWRSSPVVLDTVNRIFENVESLAVWRGDESCTTVAARWKRSFDAHSAEHTELPGYVELRVGPADDARGQVRPKLCRSAAELVSEIREAAPGHSIGVLTRTNVVVARLMYELRSLGIEASEEGGVPLVDSAGVAAVLALLRLADHPGDTIARYHVAHSPLGAAIGFTAYHDDRAACYVSSRTRRRLLEDGYGATLDALADQVDGACDLRERRRLAQLVELAFRYDADATLRTRDFIDFVETQRVEDASAAHVRVMTVHQAKGLEFDVVVLPELDGPLMRGATGPLPLRGDDGVGRVVRIFPYVAAAVRPLFRDAVPQLEEAVRQRDAAVLRDALSGLYVGLTRARHALYMIVKPDGSSGRGTAKSAALLLRDALAPDEAARAGDVLFQKGDPRWAERLAVEKRTSPQTDAQRTGSDAALVRAGAAEAEPAPLLRRAARSRGLPRRSPSELEGGARVELRRMMRIDASASALHGTIAHAWFEQIAWIEDELPSPAMLFATARRAAPGVAEEELEALARRFGDWMEMPAVRSALSRTRYGADVELERELPFLRREGDAIMEGIIDRLVLVRHRGAVVGAEILDFKTDAIEAGDEAALAHRVAFYTPQMDAYRQAVAEMHGIPASAVAVRLLFVHAGTVHDLHAATAHAQSR